MRKFVVPTMIAALLATASLAFAAQQTTGTIKSIDSSTHKLTLSDGMTFTLGSAAPQSGWKVGDKVQVSYDTSGGVNTASMVKKIQ
jgi:Cu/Ag efflux protein CusF